MHLELAVQTGVGGVADVGDQAVHLLEVAICNIARLLQLRLLGKLSRRRRCAILLAAKDRIATQTAAHHHQTSTTEDSHRDTP